MLVVLDTTGQRALVEMRLLLQFAFKLHVPVLEHQEQPHGREVQDVHLNADAFVLQVFLCY